ncbi:CDC45 family [Aspergillus avenaceus]|uniref:CDC45 family n=1 Tax=Aspergillus avenaceus TaxID=36643 RepID=A0A5N6TKM9_ASPAV|nr:CDC45 family [Aspergillus avenaceus]
MYLPRQLISHLYLQLLRSHHPLSPPVLILVALEPDALCACRILTALLKRDYIPHKIHPVVGYGDLSRAGEELVKPMQTTNGGSGGVVVCLGVGGLVDLSELLGLSNPEDEVEDLGGVEVWVFDARRPWNLANVFGGEPMNEQMLGEINANARRKTRGVDKGCITPSYKSGNGGIVVFDDGDVEEELANEREAYCALLEMPEVDEDEEDLNGNDSGSEAEGDLPSSTDSKKRKSWSRTDDEDESDEDDGPPRQRRRSNSGSSITSSPTRLRRTPNDPFHSSRAATPVSESPSPVKPKQPSASSLRRRLLRLKRKHEGILQKYYSSGTSYSEPISSLVYSLASELGREDNDLLWLAIVGVSSLELSGRTMSGVGISNALESGGSAGWGGERGERIRQILRDEVHRLNPPDPYERDRDFRGEINGVIPTTARSPTDKSIRLSPEPRFILIRHWSLYDSMLHSPYLASRLHVWTENGRKRLNKLLAKMGVSLSQSHQSYTHMDMELKRVLRQRLLKYAPMYGLDGLVPGEATGHAVSREGWGFVRCWGWKACLSATDVGVIIGAMLEVGPEEAGSWDSKHLSRPRIMNDSNGAADTTESDLASIQPRFWSAYDALSLTSESPTRLLEALPLAQHLHRSILRTGTSLLSKHQIRHLRAFRIAVVKDGPDVNLFTNPGALTKLALWIAEAIRVQERERGDSVKIGQKRAAGTPLVLAGLDEDRGHYVVVGTGGGGGVVDFAALNKRREERRQKKEAKDTKRKEKEDRKAQRAAERAQQEEDFEESDEESSSESESESEDEDNTRADKQLLRNRFGIAFQEVVQETNTRVRIDSFDHCVVEVQKEDLGAFLEALSFRSVVG